VCQVLPGTATDGSGSSEGPRCPLGPRPQLLVQDGAGCPVRKDVSENVTFTLGSGTEEEVAAILVRAFIGADAAGVKAMTWFSFWDGPDGPMGLLAKDGRKRKSYYAFETLSRQLGEYIYSGPADRRPRASDHRGPGLPVSQGQRLEAGRVGDRRSHTKAGADRGPARGAGQECAGRGGGSPERCHRRAAIGARNVALVPCRGAR